MLDFKLPELGENIESGDVVNVLVKEGDVIAANDGVVELETDKAVVELPCPYAGRIAKIHVKKGQTVKVGQAVLSIEAEQPIKPRPSVAPEASPTPAPAEPAAKERKDRKEEKIAVPDDVIPAGPAVRRLARERGVDLRQVAGSGKGGRITVEDVNAATLRDGEKAAVVETTGGSGETPLLQGEPGSDPWGAVRRERMSRVRRTIAVQMVKSASVIPHVTNFDDADVTDLEHLRKNIPPGYLGAGIKLTAMPFIIKAVGLTLRGHPLVNASLDDEKEEIVYKDYVNVGIAVDTPRGLVVPALRNADRLSIPQIAKELGRLAEKARSADFTVEDLRGGTFTISNMGAVGGTYSTPIINYPEAAILLVGRSRDVLVLRDGKAMARWMLPLSLSFDHRLVDGAEAARFLNDVIDLLQNPGKLLLVE
ncbi:MAG: 2-oxo acid dehydrogenase subunit E2 [Pirellulales bacterium]|nr:2-oxo acid dehydrogenase subunit E2 [Pirellulales bacterium]